MRAMLAVSLLLLGSPAASQETPSLAVGADFGPAFPLGEFADDGAERGWGMGASATVRFTRLLGIYASYERASFDVERAEGEEGEDSWTDNGYGVGARLWFPVRERARLHPWVQLGLGWHDLDPPIAGPEFGAVDTEGLRTIEAGGGVDVALARQILFLRPTVRYRKYSFEVEAGGERSESSIATLTLALGIVVVVASR